jgi:hypothetical protein
MGDDAKKQLKFRQVLTIDDDGYQALLGVTFDGTVYRRFYDQLSGENLWVPIPAVSSTEPQAFKCQHNGCRALIEYLPGHEEKAPDYCPAHRA